MKFQQITEVEARELKGGTPLLWSTISDDRTPNQRNFDRARGFDLIAKAREIIPAPRGGYYSGKPWVFFMLALAPDGERYLIDHRLFGTESDVAAVSRIN